MLSLCGAALSQPVSFCFDSARLRARVPVDKTTNEKEKRVEEGSAYILLMRLKDGIFLLFLLWAAWTDFRQRRVTNRCILFCFLGRCMLWTAEAFLDRGGEALAGDILKSLLEGCLMLLLCLLLSWLTRYAIGMGDVKLLGLTALYCGISRALAVSFCGLCLAAGWSLVLMAAGKRKRQDRIALVPFFLAGFFLTAFWGA